MLPLLKKDMREVCPFLVVMAALYAFAGALFHTFASEAYIYPLILFRVLLFFPVIGINEISIVENKEDRQRGYAFLFKLPLTTIRLVSAKVFRSAAIILVLCALSWVTDKALYQHREFFSSLTSVYLLTAAAVLLLEILMYWGIYRFGCLPFLKAFGVLILSSLVLSQMLLFSNKTRLPQMLGLVRQRLDRQDWQWTLVLIVCLCYTCGFWIIVATKNRRKISV